MGEKERGAGSATTRTTRTMPLPSRQAIRRVVVSARASSPNGSSTRWQHRAQERPRRFVPPFVGEIASALLVGATLAAAPASVRLEGVNKPELLPEQYTPVIDIADFLTEGEEKRLVRRIESLEADTGVKLRVLAQNYPETPGLAIKDFWGVDGQTVVFVADPNTGNIANFNVGDDVDLQVPRSFWSKVAGKYGNKFFWQNEGPEAAIMSSVDAIETCLREPEGRLKCARLETNTLP